MSELSSILYRGKEHVVKITGYSGKNPQLIFRNDCFQIYLNKNLTESRKQEETALVLRTWLREKAEEVLKEKAASFSKNVGVTFHNVRIKDTKTRWGSCSSKKDMNFNWRLIMAPDQVIDYIVIHELCHLVHMNHSKDFWDEVAKHMPGFETHKQWLKTNGAELYRI